MERSERVSFVQFSFVQRSAPPAGSAESGQSFPQQLREGGWLVAGLGLQRRKRSARFTFAKAEVAQGGEDFGSKLERARVEALAICAAVRMSDAQRAVGTPLDQDFAAMGRAVV